MTLNKPNKDFFLNLRHTPYYQSNNKMKRTRPDIVIVIDDDEPVNKKMRLVAYQKPKTEWEKKKEEKELKNRREKEKKKREKKWKQKLLEIKEKEIEERSVNLSMLI